ncbi:helix-turn-helix domain-containing protein, partial [Streptomyces caeni]
MPRWKALPDELDPQIKEFMVRLRQLVDRGGLSVSAVADRTGYSKTSWERYLNGRLLAPKGAIVALAEVTGTDPVHLTTLWELAERAWSRSEMRHDRTMEAIRISQARAALGEAGAAPGTKGRGGTGARSTTVASGEAGPAGAASAAPVRPADAEGARGGDVDSGGRPPRAGSPGGNSWGLAGYRGPSRTGAAA